MDSYIGYSTDPSIRFRATSGGVGSSYLKWLFDKGYIETSVSFEYNGDELMYEPKLIYSYDEYVPCGSIYHEIDLYGFVKKNLDAIKGGFACFALPCQTKAIRNLVNKSGHYTQIIGLTCSSQQTLDATKYLLKRSGVSEQDVKYLQYRGNGWPSGIQIEKNDGQKVFIPNNGSLWTQIFHSRLFVKPKCFKCQDTMNRFSDITLADPWLKEYVSVEKTGKSLVVENASGGGISLLQQCHEDGYIILERIQHSKILESQIGTINRKKSYRNRSILSMDYYRFIHSKIYRKLVLTPFFFNLHCKLKARIERYLLTSLSSNNRQ